MRRGRRPVRARPGRAARSSRRRRASCCRAAAPARAAARRPRGPRPAPRARPRPAGPAGTSPAARTRVPSRPPVTGSTGVPAALTTAIAPTSSPPSSSTHAVPTPPLSRPVASSVPHPAPTTPRRGTASTGRGGRLVPEVRSRPRRRVAAAADVEHGRGRRDRHDDRAGVVGRTDREAAAALLAPARDAGGRGQPVRAAAGERDRVHGRHQRRRRERVGLVGGRGAAADRHGPDGAGRRDDDRDAGQPAVADALGLPDEDAGDVGDRAPAGRSSHPADATATRCA